MTIRVPTLNPKGMFETDPMIHVAKVWLLQAIVTVKNTRRMVQPPVLRKAQ